jgi:hypothetical protein
MIYANDVDRTGDKQKMMSSFLDKAQEEIRITIRL